MKINVAQIGKTALTFSTGFGLRDLIKRHKMAAGVIVAIVVANELRGLAVAYAVLRAWGWL